MLLTVETWNRIREQFSEEEKNLLNKAITGEVIRPRGCTVDTERLGQALMLKLDLAIKKAATEAKPCQ
jgi:uncharacterized protein GlcG (DUF336 family)